MRPILFSIILIISMSFQAQSQLVFWTGQGDNRTWEDEDNWSHEDGPVDGDSVLIENVDTVFLEDVETDELRWLKLISTVLVIDAESEFEVRNAAGDGVELVMGELVNYGEIEVIGCGKNGLHSNKYSKFINHGSVVIGEATIGILFEALFLNSGTIELTNLQEGIFGDITQGGIGEFENQGMISMAGVSSRGLVIVDASNAINSGEIEIIGGQIGVQVFGLTFINRGDIAMSSVDSGILVDLTSDFFHEAGTIDLKAAQAVSHWSSGIWCYVHNDFISSSSVNVSGFTNGIFINSEGTLEVNAGQVKIENSGKYGLFSPQAAIRIEQGARLEVDRMAHLISLYIEGSEFTCFGEFIVH